MAPLPASKWHGRQHLRPPGGWSIAWYREVRQMVWVEVTQSWVKRGEVRMNMRNKFPLEVAESNLDAFALTSERLPTLSWWQIYHPSFPDFLTSECCPDSQLYVDTLTPCRYSMHVDSGPYMSHFCQWTIVTRDSWEGWIYFHLLCYCNELFQCVFFMLSLVLSLQHILYNNYSLVPWTIQGSGIVVEARIILGLCYIEVAVTTDKDWKMRLEMQQNQQLM